MATVMFVDDEPEYVESLARRLKRLGHTVFDTTNAAEAMKKVEQELVHLVVLDMMMPYIPMEERLRRSVAAAVENALRTDTFTGVRLYQEILKKYPLTKIVIFSVVSEEDIRANAPQLPFDRVLFLRKGGPYAFRNFEAIKAKLMER